MNKELYEDGSIKKTSLLLSIFQIVFTFICLYCLREVFHRWDGFSMYASFMDFLPTVALVSLLWALVAMIISVLVWFPIAAVRVIAGKLVRGISNDNIIGFYIVFIVLSFVVLYIKRHFFDMPATPLAVKAAMLFAVFTVSIVFSFLLRTVLCKLVQLISSSISPLLWIFGIWIIIAVPLVGFYTWLQPEPVKIIADSNVSDAERPNIILLTFDTLTARDMSLYGYARDTTPFMKKWAENASVFTRAQAASNYTTPTTASIVTGKRVWSHRMYHIRATNPYKSSTESMPLILKKNGYYNMAFVVNSLASVKKLGVSNSFDYDPNAAEFVEPRSFFGWNNSKFGKLDLMLYSMFGDRINFQDWIIKTDTFIVRRMKQMISDFNYTSVPVEKTFAKFIEVMDKGVPGPFLHGFMYSLLMIHTFRQSRFSAV
ncbi:MAG: sulfatase-like hydrolase/transferase [Candidatus Brocadiales bacterium]|nr:sulfatase-like hydrolase/transferase [Candidatus Brocadiales bacterium]